MASDLTAAVNPPANAIVNPDGTVSPPVALPPDPAAVRLRLERDADLTAQASFFTGIGLLLSAFVASVAASVGGQQREAMH